MKKNLTIAVAKEVPLPKSGDYIIRDAKTPGLGLRVYASGSKSWIFQMKLGNSTIRIVLGAALSLPLESVFNPTSNETRKGARQLAIEASLKIKQGLDPRLEKKKQLKVTQAEHTKNKLTVKMVWDEYIQFKKDLPKPNSLKPRTFDDYDKARLKLERSEFWNTPVSELSGLKLHHEIQRQVKLATSTKASRGGMTQASLCLRYLRAVYKHAKIAHKLQDANAFSELGQLNQGWQNTNAKNRRLGETEGQLKKWWVAVDELRNSGGQDATTIADWLQLSIFFGTRKTELLSLEWGNVDLKHDFIILPEALTKAARQHIIPLTKHVRSMLMRRFSENQSRNDETNNDIHIGKSNWVFQSSRKGTKSKQFSHIKSPNYRIAQIVKSTGIKFSPHDLRRTFATLLNEGGASNFTIEKALNHAPTSVAGKSYVNNPRLVNLRKTFQKLEDAILEEAGIVTSSENMVEINQEEYLQFLKFKETSSIEK